MLNAHLLILLAPLAGCASTIEAFGHTCVETPELQGALEVIEKGQDLPDYPARHSAVADDTTFLAGQVCVGVGSRPSVPSPDS